VSAMGSGKAVEALPFSGFGFEIDVILVIQQLVEFLAVKMVRPLHFAVGLRGAWLDAGMTNTWLNPSGAINFSPECVRKACKPDGYISVMPAAFAS
jgi:hypothetical protein